MEKYSDNQIECILKSNNFKKSKNGSFYKVLKRKGRKVFKIRISNHIKHKNFENEILINYVFKSNKDLNKILKRLIKKFNLVKGVEAWSYVIIYLNCYGIYIMIFTMT